MIIILICKILYKLVRLLNVGGGTALPGLLVEKYSLSTLTRLSRNINTIVFITGTNGKTTTQKISTSIIKSHDSSVISNKSGANLIRGIASVLIKNSSIFGKVVSDYAIFEVEEASMPQLVKYIKPKYIIVTNLFRDQLDAYGEINTTREYIIKAIKDSSSSIVIVNNDDPYVSSIPSEINNPVSKFGLNKKYKRYIEFEKNSCNSSNTKSDIVADNITIQSDLSSKFSISGLKPSKELEVEFKSPGVQNIYNALASICLANLLNLPTSSIKKGFLNYQPAFGRGEIVKFNDKYIRILLIKNPIGFTLTLKMLEEKVNSNIMIIINDKIADGRDVSWLWDANVELVNNLEPKYVGISGTRAQDMYVRLKYANIDTNICYLENSIQEALHHSLARTKKGDTLYILPTYTAMLELRKHLSTLTKIANFWE